jgi:hypothetical protein
MRAETFEAMNKAGVPPQIAYAYAKTGLLLMEEHQGNYPPEAVAEWKAAIASISGLRMRGKNNSGGHSLRKRCDPRRVVPELSLRSRLRVSTSISR